MLKPYEGAKGKVMNMQQQKTDNAREVLAEKYVFIREKIILNYQKGTKILKIAKITVAVLFVLFTICAVVFGARSGKPLSWLCTWIILIFLNIIIFVPADYAKYLISSKVIPYLQDDEQIEFGEYDIFRESDETQEDEQEQED